MDPRTRLHQILQTWHPPRELESARPREVRFTLGGKVTAVIAAIILFAGILLFGLSLYVNGLGDGQAQDWFAEAGLKDLTGWHLMIMGGLAVLLAGAIIRSLMMQRRLLAEGRSAPAIITRIVKADHGMKVAHFVFMEMGGKLIEGKSKREKNPPAVESILNVIYEPDRERHNRPYPLSLFKTKFL
jgi:hypothetical protein